MFLNMKLTPGGPPIIAGNHLKQLHCRKASYCGFLGKGEWFVDRDLPLSIICHSYHTMQFMKSSG